jgi:hypothetical protein
MTTTFDQREREPFDSVYPGRPAKHGWRNPPLTWVGDHWEEQLPYRLTLASLGEWGEPHPDSVLAFFRERARDAMLDSDRYFEDWAARQGYVPCAAATRLEWHRVGRDEFTEDVEPGSGLRVSEVGPDYCEDPGVCPWHK